MDSWIKWIVIGVLLVLQTGTHTVNRRASATGSPAYTFWATFISSALYLVSHVIILREIWVMLQATADVLQWAYLIVFYAACNGVGGALFHWLSMRYLERNHNRKVGVYT